MEEGNREKETESIKWREGETEGRGDEKMRWKERRGWERRDRKKKSREVI